MRGSQLGHETPVSAVDQVSCAGGCKAQLARRRAALDGEGKQAAGRHVDALLAVVFCQVALHVVVHQSLQP